VQTTERFAPRDPLPRFLSDHADEYETRAVEREPRESIWLLNGSILVMTTALISIAITLSWGNPVKVFTDTRAALMDASSQAATTPQVAADTRVLPPAATGTSTPEETPAASADSAEQKQADIAPPAGALLGQFEAWAARQYERAQDAPAETQSKAEPKVEAKAEPARPVDEPPARRSRVTEAQDDEPPVRIVRRHRPIRPVQNARAEMRSVRKPAARVRQEQTARAVARPQQEVRPQELPAQNAAPPSFTYWRQQ
jgi:hypothetical protein